MLISIVSQYIPTLILLKGSYVVTRVAAEKKVSFDNGAAGSIAEDTYFAMKAVSQG